jgi:hypothetical protein
VVNPYTYQAPSAGGRVTVATVVVRSAGVLSALLFGVWGIVAIIRDTLIIIPWPILLGFALTPMGALVATWRPPRHRKDLRFISSVLSVWVGLFSFATPWNIVTVVCCTNLLMVFLIPRHPDDGWVRRFRR